MKNLKFITKIIVSAAFMAFAVSRVDFQALGKVLGGANLYFIIAAFFLFGCAMMVMVLRWEVLLRLFHKDIHFNDLLSIYWMGLFFNLFLPSSVGGDVVKMYKLSKKHGKPIESSTTVLLDRIIGLTSLTFLALINFLLFGRKVNFQIAGVMIFGIAFGLVGFYFVIFNKEIMRRFTFIRWIFRIFKIEQPIKDLYLSFNNYRHHPGVLLKAFSISLCVNLLVSTYLYLLARSVGIDIPLIFFFIIMPVVFIITMIPISVSGLGLQDGAYVFFLGQLGVSPTLAFSMSLLAHATRYGVFLLGGFAYMFEKDKPQLKS